MLSASALALLAVAAIAATQTPRTAVVLAAILRAIHANVGRSFPTDCAGEYLSLSHFFSVARVRGDAGFTG